MLTIPAIINSEHYVSLDTQAVQRIGGGALAKLTLTPAIKAYSALEAARIRLLELQRIPSERIFQALREVAELLSADDWSFTQLSKHAYCAAVSESTGLPLELMPEEIEDIVQLLQNLEAITRVQLPDDSGASLDTHGYRRSGHDIGFYPAGQSLLVRVPGNIPSICVYWLMPLALKRPVILIPPHEDPFTHMVLVDAIRTVAPWLATYIQFLPCSEPVFAGLLPNVDQIIMSQSLTGLLQSSPALTGKTYLIHYGRSKLLIQGSWTDAAVETAWRRMRWKCGRTCTGLTSIIVTERGRPFCEQLAGRIGQQIAATFEQNLDRLPLFETERARRMDALIESHVQRGDVEDVTRALTGRPRLLTQGARSMLLPTVLWVKAARSPAFGVELPFPFITVAEAHENERLIELARDTLILSVLSEDASLLERLYQESSIRKVFGPPHIERGYHFLDPHEGYMADFLYQKKAILPPWDARHSTRP